MARASHNAARMTTSHASWKRAVRGVVHRMGPFLPGDLVLELDGRDASLAPEFVRSHRRAQMLSVGTEAGSAVRAAPWRLPVDDGAVFHVAVHLWGERDEEVLGDALRVTGPSGKLYLLVHRGERGTAAETVEAWLRRRGVERLASQVLVRSRAGTEVRLVTGRLPWGEHEAAAEE